MRNDVSIPPDEPHDGVVGAPEHDTPPREAKTAHRAARNTDTHLVNPAEKTHLTHPNMDPSIEMAARRSDEPDTRIYDTPSTMRESASDLTLSSIILILAVVAVLVVFLMWFWK